MNICILIKSIMLYTICGGIIGCIVSYCIAKCIGVSFRRGTGGPIQVPSAGDITVFSGILIGCGIGFGIGVISLMNGTHAINKLL